MQGNAAYITVKRKTVVTNIVILIALAIATPAFADYLGPDRTVTEWGSTCKIVLLECQYISSKNVWRYRQSDDWSCSLESKPWNSYPSQPSSQGCFSATEGDQYWERNEVLQEVTTTHPPATITGTLQNCTLQNGWCITVPQLELSATEPLSGYDILAIEGTLNGQTFACSDSNCNVTLNEGNNDFTYWALSSWGDSSTMGTLSAMVDSISPSVGLDVSGTSGTNGWFTSPAVLSAFGADWGSGLAEASLSVEGGVWQPSATLNEGVYNVTVRAFDNAGNISTTSTTLSVDTTTPSLNVSINGTLGGNAWYKTTTQVSATASDATSGIAALEVSVDGGTYQTYTAPVSFSDGSHTVQFKATDRAGNRTESTIQSFAVDTMPPEIFVSESWELGEAVQYVAQDPPVGSGLASLRLVIEDEEERFAKVTWNEDVSGDRFTGFIDWDGKFKDGTVAPPGTYFAWIKASDMAGNEYVALGQIIVPEPNSLFRIFQPVTVSTQTVNPAPPAELFEEDALSPTLAAHPTSTFTDNTVFGGSTVQAGISTNQSLFLDAGTASSTPTSSNVLWGAAAAAVLGAATAYALEENSKRKEAEEAQRAAIVARIEEMEAQKEAAHQARKVAQWLEGQDLLNHALESATLNGASEQEIENLKRMGVQQGFGKAIDATKSLTSSLQRTKAQLDRKELEEEKALLKKLAKNNSPDQEMQQQLAGLAAYYEAMRAGEKGAAKPNWWEKTWNTAVDWVDSHQTQSAILTGLVVAAATIAIVVSLPAIALTFTTVAIASLAAAAVTVAIVGAGTMALNNAKNRPPTTNLVSNVFAGGATALVVTGLTLAIAGGIVTQALISVGNTVALACGSSPSAMNVCSQIGPVVDGIEQFGVGFEMTVQMALGDEEGAAQTAIEYQLEAMDGGAPGNSIAAELGEQLAKLGDEATDLIARYGDDIVPLLVMHGDDAIEIIGKYGDDGITILTKFGDDAERAILLIKQKDKQAIKVLQAVDLDSAEKLFTTLDEDVLDYVVKQDSDAIVALSRWKDNELLQFGPELALRAKNDAKALKAVEDLINSKPIDPKNLTTRQAELIEIIAEYSKQYNDAGQIVLGKWVDFGNGFTAYARGTGSVHYNPHPDMWNMLGQLGKEQQEEVAWLINKQVIETGIEKGLPFEYTLSGNPANDIPTEQKAVQLIFSGSTDSEIMEKLNITYIPIRMKELRELQKAGYVFVFDEASNSFILSLK